MASTTHKYLFYLTYSKGVIASAASKPVTDTSKTLHRLGYKDYSLVFETHTKSAGYYLRAIAGFLKFFFSIKSNSIVATQSPIPTVGNFFKYFIPLARLRGIKFITLIHDVDSLRAEHVTDAFIKNEVDLLSKYDGIIVHNDYMRQWLVDNGLKKNVQVVPLHFFDYLGNDEGTANNSSQQQHNQIAFAGHLEKSTFIYSLQHIKNWSFNIYGSDFNTAINNSERTTWKGTFTPDEIAAHLQGSFGLVWDGADSNNIGTNRFGNYMRYNNPFKFSLYLAAGLPVIAPKHAAIAATIGKYNIGFLIESLEELDRVHITDDAYSVMKKNVAGLQKDIKAGKFLTKAVTQLEALI